MMARIGLLDSPEVRLPLIHLEEERQRILDGVLRRAGLLGDESAEAPAACAPATVQTGKAKNHV